MQELARWLNPAAASPSAPRETVAALDAFGPSLMPRTATLHGVAMGLGVLGARATTGVVEKLTRLAVPADASLPAQLVARAVIGGAGAALAAVPERHCHKLWAASLRSTGQLLRDGAAGAAVHDLGRWVQRRYPSQPAVRPIAAGAIHTAGLLYRTGRRLPARQAGGDRWPRPPTATLPGALATSYAVTTVGTGLARGFAWSRGALESYFGPGPSKRVLARLVNAGLWAWGDDGRLQRRGGLCGAGQPEGGAGLRDPARQPAAVGERREPAALRRPRPAGTPLRHRRGHPRADRGGHGGAGAVAQPIRTYVGFNSEPLYQTGRAELALAELDRAGAFDRSYLLLISPTGTGWVDQTLIEAAEFLARGDIATCCIQYARYPSFLSVQKVALGRRQFRLLLWGVKQRLAGLPPEGRPRVLVFGESMGAWTSSDVLMYQGIDGFDHYGIDRALWVGLPWLAKWSRSGMTRGSSTLVPPGTVGVFDRHEQLAALDDDQRARLRAVVVSHDNDPIAVFGPDLLVQRPTWLADGQRGRGVPAQLRWLPVVTFLQTGMDAMNAMLKVPGEFTSFGHDYRADMAGFVGDVYRLPTATAEQQAGIEQVLRTLELERAERIKAEHSHAAPPAPAQRPGGDRAPVACRSAAHGPVAPAGSGGGRRTGGRAPRRPTGPRRGARPERQPHPHRRSVVGAARSLGVPGRRRAAQHRRAPDAWHGQRWARRRRPPPAGCRPTGCRCCRR